MKQILIVEDDRSLLQGLCLALKDPEYQILSCPDLAAARRQFSLKAADLVLLDLNLPDGNGIDFLKELKHSDTPPAVILLTANDTEMDVVLGLECGADDYITKPFSLAILRARVRVLLRRNNRQEGKPVVLDSYRFDFENMLFYHEDTPVELSKTEQKLLRLLVENRGRTLGRAQLLDRVWGDGADYVDENALSVTIKRLRDKLDASEYIKTVYGLGYVWAGKQET